MQNNLSLSLYKDENMSDERTYKSTCRICHRGCGVLMHVEDRVVKIKGDTNSPLFDDIRKREMRALTFGFFLVFILTTCAYADDTKDLNQMGIPGGMAGCFGTVQSEVLQVFLAEDNGARFRAYQVKWKGQDIIVSDMFGTTDFKEGDIITFMAQNIEVPANGKKLKMLQFMIMDTSAFAPEQ